MNAVLSFLKARAGELSSVIAASGAAGVAAAYLTGQLTGQQAIVGVASAVVAYVWPESKLPTGTLKALGYAFAFVGALALSACASLGLTGNPANDLPIVSQDILKTVNVACAEYAPVGALAVLVPDPKVQAIALTTNGVCDVATGAVIPGVEAKLDASSAAWVGLSVGMLKALGVQPVAAAAVPAKS